MRVTVYDIAILSSLWDPWGGALPDLSILSIGGIFFFVADH